MDPLTYEKISRRIENFIDLSETEKDSVKSTVKTVAAMPGGDRLIKTLDSIRKNEGKVFSSLVHRYISVTQSSKGSQEGVNLPLDTVLYQKGEQIEIYFPEDLDSYSDSGIILDLLRYTTDMPGVIFTRCKGKVTSPEEKGNFFFMGYISELLSTQRVERISYSRDSTYQTGRACARTKLLLGVMDPLKVPTKFLKIPDRFLGGTQEFRESELTRSLRIFFPAADVDRIERLLHNLTSHTLRVRRQVTLAKMGENLFQPVSEFLHAFKRKTRRNVQAKRGKKISSVLISIDPTKPSQLATIAPWERNAVSEVFEDSWKSEKDLISQFEELKGFDRNYKDFGDRITKIFDTQWNVKQKVLRQTKHRLSGYPGDKEAKQFLKLNWIRDLLSTWASIESVPRELYRDMDPSSIFSGHRVLTKDKFEISLLALKENEEVAQLYPEVSRLLSTWDSITKTSSAPQKGTDEE
jgi:hypothetical protein